MNNLRPWSRGPFELLVHAEIHLREGADFDRRLALIGFDNAIEVAIASYLALHPVQRGGREYQKADIEKWSNNYHTKLGFLEKESTDRSHTLAVPKAEIIYYHRIRNDQYHAGSSTVPQEQDLKEIRKAAMDIFAMLFDVTDIELLLGTQVLAKMNEETEVVRERNRTVDRLIDMASEITLIFGQPYSSSKALFATDYEVYHAIEASIEESRNVRDEFSLAHPDCLRPEIGIISFIHYEELVYLKVVTDSDEVELTEMDFVEGSVPDSEYFSLKNLPDENATLLVQDFDPYSIINTTDLFTEEAAQKVTRRA